MMSTPLKKSRNPLPKPPLLRAVLLLPQLRLPSQSPLPLLVLARLPR